MLQNTYFVVVCDWKSCASEKRIQSTHYPMTVKDEENNENVDLPPYSRRLLRLTPPPASLVKYAYRNFRNLTTADLGNSSIKEIPHFAFSGCSALVNVRLPDALETIEFCAFFDCTSLKKIKFPFALKTIGQDAFARCPINVVDLSACSNLITIRTRAFGDNMSLTKVILPFEMAASTCDNFRLQRTVRKGVHIDSFLGSKLGLIGVTHRGAEASVVDYIKMTSRRHHRLQSFWSAWEGTKACKCGTACFLQLSKDSVSVILQFI